MTTSSKLMQEGRDESYSMEVKMKTPHDTEWHYCTIIGIPFGKDPVTNKVVKYVGFRKDNTEIVKLNDEMNEYAQKMRYVLNHSKILVWDYDTCTQSIIMDYGDAELKEYITREKFLQKRIPPLDRIYVTRFLDRMQEGKEDEFSLQCRLIFFDADNSKEMHYVVINGMPIRDNSKKIIAYSGLCRDITDLILTQHRLKHETEKALQSDKLKSAFIANMSHEIRTPLNAIVGFSELMQEAESLQERQEYMQIIKTNNELLLSLINDILDLSRIESGEMTLKREEFDMAGYFDFIVASLQQRNMNPKVRFIIENPYRVCRVYLDRNRVAQIITNFATNAIKHTQKGYIKIGYVYNNDGLRIYVEDTGAGIPADKHDIVFRRFEKLNSFVQGTGLGLSICKAIIDACGGKINFTSEEGKGACFWAWIPCDAEVVLKSHTH